MMSNMDGRSMAVSVIGNDRPGIVAGVTRSLFESGCNLEDVSSTILRGHFSMVLIVRAPDSLDPAELESSLNDAVVDLDLVVTVRLVDDVVTEVAAPTHMVSVYGADQPGIVFRVAQGLADAGANVTDLTSRVIGDPAEPVYALMLEVSAPEAGLEEILDSLRKDLGLDASVHPIDADVL
jgi:glycine cleavage system transcriptional repressor